MYGKWHLGMHKESVAPWNRGFDHHAGYLQGCGSGWTHVASCCHASSSPTDDEDYICPKDSKSGTKDYRGYDWFTNGIPDLTANGTRSAELIRKHSLHFLETRNQTTSSPFFLYLPFQNIHGPYDVPLSYVELYTNMTDLTEEEKVMYGYISEMDDVIGDILETLHERNLYDNTLIIFSSDNGAPPGPRGVRDRNWPLRGHKTQIWEGGVKVPGFISGGILPIASRGTISHELYHVTDWLPTIQHAVTGQAAAAAAAAAAPTMTDNNNTNNKMIDGLDVWLSMSEGTPSPRKEMVYNVNPLCDGGQAGPPKAGLRKLINGTNWKILTYCYLVAGRGGASDNVTTGPVVPSSFPPDGWPEHFHSTMLFNLDNDPTEMNDVSLIHPLVVNILLKRLKMYAMRSVEPMQWIAPYQGPDYECAACPLRAGSHGNPNMPWTPWIS